MELITIATFSNVIDLHIIKGRLENEGIRCFIKDEYTITANPLYDIALGGIKLQVEEKDVDTARKILNQDLLPNDTKPNSIWNKFDNATLRLPILKKYSFLTRFIIMLISTLIILTTPLYILMMPDLRKLLTTHNWCLQKVYYNNQEVIFNRHSPQLSIVTIADPNCTERLIFAKNGTIYLTDTNGNSIDAFWKLNDDNLTILSVNRRENIFNGSYMVEAAGNQITIKSNTTTIYLQREKEIQINLP